MAQAMTQRGPGGEKQGLLSPLFNHSAHDLSGRRSAEQLCKRSPPAALECGGLPPLFEVPGSRGRRFGVEWASSLTIQMRAERRCERNPQPKRRGCAGAISCGISLLRSAPPRPAWLGPDRHRCSNRRVALPAHGLHPQSRRRPYLTAFKWGRTRCSTKASSLAST